MGGLLIDHFDPGRVLRDLHELRELSGGARADRLAWSRGWLAARELLRRELTAIGIAPELDPAGNLWATLPGRSRERLVLGSHLDAVPSGGWLDGTLGVMAALEVLRAVRARDEQPARTLALVDWADEEGARFGRALYGSAAATGALDVAALADAVDGEGRTAREVLGACGVELERAREAVAWLDGVTGYLELHIEQGPVLDDADVSVAPVSGTVAVRRVPVTIEGVAEHVGPPPMDGRRDAVLGLARFVLAVRELADRHGGRTTVTVVEVEPNVPTVIAGRVRASVDLRHERDDGVEAMHAGLARAAATLSCAGCCEIALEPPSFSAIAGSFDPQLVALAGAACAAAGGSAEPLVSGALHDATSLSHRVPTAMVFCRSLGGVSHTPAEDSRPEDVLAAASAFARLVDGALAPATLGAEAAVA